MQTSEADIVRLADALESVWQQNGKLLLMGNGGSAATASHFANDFQKCIQCEAGRPIRAMCLSDCGSLLLAWANDTEYSNVFAPQVACWAEPGDLVIGISGSGNSPNVLNGIEAANRLGARTFGLAGFGGGRLAEIAQDGIVVHSNNMQLVEDLHSIILHAAFTELRERLKERIGG
jgi:D-sedoheptulose 7-phosphate isomerase